MSRARILVRALRHIAEQLTWEWSDTSRRRLESLRAQHEAELATHATPGIPES